MRSRRSCPGFLSEPDRLFVYRLAERLGRTVAELEAGMSNREFMGWIAVAQFDELERRKAELKGAGRGGK